MDELADSRARLESALRRVQWSALGLLACCAIFVALQTVGESPAAFNRAHTTAAVGAGLATVLLRRFSMSPVVAPRSAVVLAIGGFIGACLLGGVGALVAAVDGDRQAGFIYVGIAALFCIRPIALPSAAASSAARGA